MKRILFLFSLVAVLLLSSCGSAYLKSLVSDESTLAPADFGKGSAIILIEKERLAAYNRLYEDYFTKYYHGRFILASKEEIETTYADTDKYKYILRNKFALNFGTNNHAESKDATLILLDRITKQTYSREDVSQSLYKRFLKAYIQKLESIRSRNNQ